MLHPLGELDHHLKPKSRVADLEDEDDEETEEGGKPKTGTKKRRSSIAQAQTQNDNGIHLSLQGDPSA